MYCTWYVTVLYIIVYGQLPLDPWPDWPEWPATESGKLPLPLFVETHIFKSASCILREREREREREVYCQ